MTDPTSLQPVLIAPAWSGAAAAGMTRYRALQGPDSDGRPSPSAMAIWDRDVARRPYAFDGGIALIPVYGLLVPKLGWIGASWITGYDGLRVQLAHAFDNPEVKAICFDVDTGGGYTSGLFDLIDWIADRKAATGKTVAAICSDRAYSAGYALAATADTIAVPRTGGVGSIGVWLAHTDYSRMLDQAGITVTVIQSGDRKTDGHPYAPLPESVRADLKAQVDDLRQLFAATVARLRGLDAAAVLATEGRCYEGPAGTAEAVRLGLADAVLPPDQAYAALVNHVTTEG